MSLGKAGLLLTLTVAAFLALSLKEHRDVLKEWEATAADLRRQLVQTRGEVAHLKALNTSPGQEKPRDRVAEMGVAAEELEKAATLLAEERDKVGALQRELQLARQAAESLKDQTNTGPADLVPAVDQKATDDARQLAEARQQLTALTREISETRQEHQRLKEQSATALEQANRRAREREAALTRDLRSARRDLQRANQKREAAAEPGGQPIAATVIQGGRAQLGQ